MKRNLIIGGIALALLLISIKFFPYHCNCQARTAGVATSTAAIATSTDTEQVAPSGPTVTIGKAVFSVRVADTEAKREQGLSGTQPLCAQCGMLFVFPSVGKPGFWMKDMNYSLDIVWVGQDKKIVGVEKNLSPASYPKIVYPSAPTLYVLELPAGTYDQNNMKVGEVVEMNL